MLKTHGKKVLTVADINAEIEERKESSRQLLEDMKQRRDERLKAFEEEQERKRKEAEKDQKKMDDYKDV
jgi:hypothetical protein